MNSRKKAVPLQVLHAILKRSVEAALAGEVSGQRRLATTLERYAAQLRMSCGGKRLLEGKKKAAPKSQPEPDNGKALEEAMFWETYDHTFFSK